MGLLDEDSFNTALMQAGLAMLANNTSRNPMRAIGAGGLAGIQGYRQAQKERQLEQMHKHQMLMQQMQMDEYRRKLDMEKKKENFFTNTIPGLAAPAPEFAALSNGMGPTQSNAAQIPNMPPKGTIDPAALNLAMLNSGIPDIAVTGMQGLVKDNAPIKMGKDDRLLQRTPTGYKTVIDAIQDQAKIPTQIQEYEYSQKNPDFTRWLMSQKQAGANINNIALKVGNSFGETVAKSGAERLMGQVESAAQVPQTVAAGRQIIDALNTGKVMAGPGTTWKVAASQLFGGDSEKLNATRSTIQGLAKLGLGSRQSLRGQGTITDAEQKLLERAVAGDIDGMTVGEIRLVVDGTMKNAQFIYSQGQKASEALKKMPEFRSILPAFDLPNVSFPNTQQAPSYPPGAVREK